MNKPRFVDPTCAQASLRRSCRRRDATRDNGRRGGFTLLEMLVTVTVVAILATIGATSFLRMQRVAIAQECVIKLRAIGSGIALLLGDNAMKFPELAASREDKSPPSELELPTLDLALAEYIEDERAFHCPADHHYFQTTGCSYYWNSTVNGQLSGALNFLGLTKNHSGIPLVSDKENFHKNIGDGVNILYADGHVQKELQFTVDAN